MTTPLAIITGGAQGIGRATVELLLSEGWRIAALDRDAGAVAELDEAHPASTLLSMAVDVGDELQVKEAFHHLTHWQQENDQSTGVDLLVNNAGLADPVCGPIEALAVSLGPEIRVNAICPGWIETGPWQKNGRRTQPDHRDIDRDQHPVGRVGEPGDVAATVAFLASDKAGFITGQHISVDGGMTKKMIYAE